MKNNAVAGLNMFVKAPIVSVAGTLLIAAPALANNAGGQHRAILNQMRAGHPGGGNGKVHQRGPALGSPAYYNLAKGEKQLSQNLNVQNNLSERQIRLNQNVGRFNGRSYFVNDLGRNHNIAKGLELDLTSDQRAIVLGDNLFSGASSYTIQVGGESKVLTSGAKVSAAEFVALQQVIDGNSQSLVVDGSGKGVDGTFNLASIDDAGRNIHAASLVVPTSVDAVGNFAPSADFRVTGDLVNYGSVFALSDKPGAANISARNITNNSNASISSEIDLNLAASRNFNNWGTVESAGSLTVSAGRQLNNKGSLTAHNNLNLLSSDISNSGSIKSNTADINVDTAVPSNINFDNTGGTVSALNGAVNFRVDSFTGKYDTNLTGGDWLSKELNLYSGDGNLEVRVGEVTAAVTAHAGVAHIGASTANLYIKELCTSGDPLVQNSAGSLNIGTFNTLGAPLSIVASQDINIQSGVTISTDNAAGNAGNILMVAGAINTLAANLTITGPSATGGNINFAGTAPIITASGTGGNGGDITLVAFTKADKSQGTISLNGATKITSQGSAGKNNGNILAIAGGTIVLGSINNKGAGSLSSGTIDIQALDPVISGGSVVIDGTTGAVLSGSFVPGTKLNGFIGIDGAVVGDKLFSANSSDFFSNNTSVNADTVSIQAVNSIFLNNFTIQSGQFNAGKNLVIAAPLTATKSVAGTALGDISINAKVAAPGGIVLVAGGNISNGLASNQITAAEQNGNAGSVTMVSGAKFNVNANSIDIIGSSVSTGNLDLNNAALVSSEATAGMASGKGGEINLISLNGFIGMGSSVNVLSGGDTNSNGNITMVATSNIQYDALIDTTSGTSGTGSIAMEIGSFNGAVTISTVNGAVSIGTFLGGTGAATPGTSIFSPATGQLLTDNALISLKATSTGSTALDIQSVNSQGGAVRLDAPNGGMNLRFISAGSIAATAGGNVQINGNLITVNGGGVVVLAGKDIQNAKAGNKITTTSSGNAGSVTLVAGAAYTENAGILTVTGNSSTGGNLLLGNSFGGISTDSASSGNGGNINIIAFSDAGGANGFIDIGNGVNLLTRGLTAGKTNGDITVVSGNNQGISGITTGATMNTGAGGVISGSGNITLATTLPGAGVTISETTGGITGGAFTGGALRNSSIVGAFGVSSFSNQDALFILESGKFIDMNGTTANVGFARYNSFDSVQALGAITATGWVSVTSFKDINLRGDIIAPQGVSMVAGGSIINITVLDKISTSTAGNAGNVTLVAGAAFTQDATSIIVNGPSFAGGSVSLGSSFSMIDTRSTGGGSGGTVQLIANCSSGLFLGQVFLDQVSKILTGGVGTNNNGDVIAVAGASDKFTGVSANGTIDTTGGKAGTGTVTLHTELPAPNPVTIARSGGGVTFGTWLGFSPSNSTIDQGTSGKIITNGADVSIFANNGFDSRSINTGSAGIVDILNFGGTTNIRTTTTGSLIVASIPTIQIGGDLTVANSLILVSNKDVLNGGGANVFKGSDATGSGANITMVAGGVFQSQGNTVTIFGGSGLGGTINLFGNTGGITTRGLGINASGGDLTLIAFADGSGAFGQVNGFGTSTLLTGGSGTGANGDVIIVAGNNQGAESIANVGAPLNVDTTGGAVGTGDVILSAAIPNSATNNVVIDKPTGAVISGSFLGGTLQDGIISVGTITTTGVLSQGHSSDWKIGPINSPTNSFAYQTSGKITVVGLINVLGLDLLANDIDVQFNVTGHNLTFDSQIGSTNFNGTTLTVAVDGSGNGGDLTINAQQVFWATAGTSPLVLDASGTTGFGGSVSVTQGSNAAVNLGTGAGDYTLLAKGGGGSVAFTAGSATITVEDPAALDVTAGTNRNGGGIFLSGASLVAGVAGGPTVLTAAGNGTGAGGSVILVSGQATSMLIDNVSAGTFSLNAAGGASGSAGAVGVTTNGDLTVAPIGLNVTPGANGNGGGIVLSANGSLLVTSGLNVAGNGTGAGGNISLTSNSATDFDVAGKKVTTNGVKGLLVVSGPGGNGDVGVTNLGGGIILNQDLTAVDDVNLTAGGNGSITLGKALGNTNSNSLALTVSGTGVITAKKELSAFNVFLTSGAGAIGGKKAMKVNTASLTANADGQVNITNSRTTPLTLNASTSTLSSFTLTSAGDITVDGNVGANGSVTIQSSAKNGSIILDAVVAGGGTTSVIANGTGTITQTLPAVASVIGIDVVLQTKSGKIGTFASPILINATNLTANTTGDVFIDNLGTTPIDLVDANSTGQFQLRSNGDIVVDASLKSAFTINFTTLANDGVVTINQSQGGKATSGITVKTDGIGDITQSSTKIKLTGTTINFSSDQGDIGTINALNTVSTILSMNTGGSGTVNVVSGNKTAVNLKDSSAGGLFVFNASSGMNVDDVTADTIKLITSGGLLKVNNNSAITTNSTTDGSILLQHSTDGKGLQIEIGTSATIASKSTAVGGGRVDIIVGAFPPPQVAGATPANVTEDIQSGGAIFYNNGITANGTVSKLTAIGTTLTFNSGKTGAGAIVLDGGATITADPTVPYVAPVVEITASREHSPRTAPVIESASFSNGVGSSAVPMYIDAPAVNSNILNATTNIQSFSSIPTDVLGTRQHADQTLVKFAMLDSTSGAQVVSLYDGFNAGSSVAAKQQIFDAYIWADEDLGLGNTASVLKQETSSDANKVEKAELRRGAVVFAPSHDTKLTTPFGVVEIGKGSIAFVVIDEHRLGVYDLHDSRKASISVSVNEQKTVLAPGQCAVLTDRMQHSFEQVNPMEAVSYKRLASREIGGGRKAFHGEFNTLSALGSVRTISTLCASKHANARRLSDKLMKTAAVLMHLSNGAEYRLYSEPQVTAMR